MTPKPSPWLALPILAAAAMFAPAPALAGNSATSIAAGGLVPRRDARIAIAKEVVRISDRKVVVEYDLRNDSASDVTTDLMFPVPAYQNAWDAMDPAAQAFRSLKIWADGQPVKYQSEAKADLDGIDITKTLEKAHIDVPTFGHLDLGRNQGAAQRKVFSADYERLTPKERKHLRNEGIYKGSEGYTLYTVNLEYHWSQTFPAHSTVHIRQEYVPVVGFTEAPPQAEVLKAALTPAANQAGAKPVTVQSGTENPLGGFCADTKFVNSMMAAHKAFSQSFGQGILPHWVDFNLLSAADWHEPIEDFTLIVEIPQPENGLQTLVSFCSPGVVEKGNTDHPEVHLTKYVPGTDLHIGFFNAPLELGGAPVAAR
jgi:hypothetical protein